LTVCTLVAGVFTGLAGTAQARPTADRVSARATTQGPCTVAPKTPRYIQYNATTDRWTIDYPVVVSCSPGRTVRIEQKRFEEDWNTAWPFVTDNDDFLGSTVFVRFVEANNEIAA